MNNPPVTHRTISIGGLVLVILGILLLLESLDLFDFDFGQLLHNWWPLIFIVLGINHLLVAERASGSMLIIFGLLLLLSTNDLISTGMLFALALIGLGVAIIVRPRHGCCQPAGEFTTTTGDTVNIETICGESRRKVTTEFKGGTTECLLGNLILDLREALFLPASATLRVQNIFGKTTVLIPNNVSLAVTGTPVFGSINNHAAGASGESLPKIVINAQVVFGELEIGN